MIEFKTRAGTLTADDIGLEALLPGLMYNGAWEDTWSPITMISHTKKGVTKIRRHPDGHVDHSILSNDEVTLRYP